MLATSFYTFQGKLKEKNLILGGNLGLGKVAQLVGASSHTPKDCGFNSQSGYIPRLWV